MSMLENESLSVNEFTYRPAYKTPMIPLAPACIATPTNNINAESISDNRRPMAFATYVDTSAPRKDPA